MNLQSQGSLPGASLCPAPGVCSGDLCSPLCPSHCPAPGQSSLILSAPKITGENPIHFNYRGFQCFHLRRIKAWFKKYHLQSCKVLQRWELLNAHPMLRSPSQQHKWQQRSEREKGSFRIRKQNVNSAGIKWHRKFTCCFKPNNLVTWSNLESLIRANHFQLLILKKRDCYTHILFLQRCKNKTKKKPKTPRDFKESNFSAQILWTLSISYPFEHILMQRGKK